MSPQLRLWAMSCWLAVGMGFAATADAQPAQPVAPGPLSKAHSSLEGAENCQTCHEAGTQISASQCLICHDPIAERIAAKKGVHRSVTDECAMCHVEHQGLNADLRPLDAEGFEHAGETGFPLEGQHAPLAADCAKCHKTRSFLTLRPACSSCHADPHDGSRGADCRACHTPGQWMVVSRAFHKTGAFQLDGKHLSVPCESCHLNNITKGTPTQCFDCHWVRRQDDRYRTRLGSQCEQCHRPVAWTAVRWDHASNAGLALNLQHRVLACDTCHVDQVFKGSQVRCISCHQADYQRAVSPNHAAAGFPVTCDICHSPSDSTFRGVRFDHNGRFPLVGVHAAQPCAACHQNNVYQGTSQACVSCHRADYDRAQNPNHVAAGFPTTCETCHQAAAPSFQGATFTHATFRPAGVHATQPCAACHQNNVYQGTSQACVSCHQADYQRTATPNHAAAGFPTTCETCHQAAAPSFQGATFTHATFRPAGVHATQVCAACHQNNVYQGTSQACVSCHRADYDRAQNPNHATAGFPTTCEACHQASASSFRNSTFNHSSTFALVGVHATQNCAACHKNNVYRGTPRECYPCHQTQYQQAQNPNHVAAALPTTCATCHQASAPNFRGATFTHATFRPAGVHATQACAACHQNNVYQGTSQACVSCHRADYDGAQNPNHVAAGFPTTCETCHQASASSFRNSTFNHSSTFALVGVHATQNCAACHKNNVYRGTPRECYPCHQTQYQQAQNPNHVAAALPTTCATCHQASAPNFRGATFTHATFRPAGVHATQACAACHANNVYQGTSQACVSCHRADYDGAQNPNHVAAGFPTTCETCHQASATSFRSATFNHNSTFALVGVHATQACSACHKNNVYRGTPRTCVGCHQPNYQQTRNPNHVAAGFPTTCETCHNATDTAWTQGRFNHTAFPITSGRHSGNPCSACHTDPTNFRVFSCVSCHNRAETDSDHRGNGGYRYDSQACYTCHPQGRKP